MKHISEYGILQSQIIDRLEVITKCSISNNIVFTNRSTSKNPNIWTIRFFNYNDEKHYKATLKYGCLISNIREFKL